MWRRCCAARRHHSQFKREAGLDDHAIVTTRSHNPALIKLHNAPPGDSHASRRSKRHSATRATMWGRQTWRCRRGLMRGKSSTWTWRSSSEIFLVRLGALERGSCPHRPADHLSVHWDGSRCRCQAGLGALCSVAVVIPRAWSYRRFRCKCYSMYARSLRRSGDPAHPLAGLCWARRDLEVTVNRARGRGYAEASSMSQDTPAGRSQRLVRAFRP